MSQNATWIIVSWTALGATAASAMQPISTTHLTKPTTPNTLVIATRTRFDAVPRPPPDIGLVVWQVVTTAVLFGLLAWRFGPQLELLAYSFLAAVAVPLSAIDALEMRLPRQLVLPLYPACLTLFGLAAAVDNDGARFARAAAGMAVLLAAYFATAVLSHGGLGAGDVRAAGPIGLTLAWLSWPTLLTGTLLSLLCATATAALSRRTTNSSFQREFPFGPAMFGGTFLAILM
jgi:leader peptidase (prepilin peptidase) / N-methyltransferase